MVRKLMKVLGHSNDHRVVTRGQKNYKHNITDLAKK